MKIYCARASDVFEITYANTDTTRGMPQQWKQFLKRNCVSNNNILDRKIYTYMYYRSI